MKTKVIGIQPNGATISRVNGTAVIVGDEIAHEEAVTLTMPHGTKGGSIQFGAGATVVPRVTERFAAPSRVVETDDATPQAIANPPVLAVSDSATPPRASADARRAGAPPAVKVNL